MLHFSFINCQIITLLMLAQAIYRLSLQSNVHFSDFSPHSVFVQNQPRMEVVDFCPLAIWLLATRPRLIWLLVKLHQNCLFLTVGPTSNLMSMGFLYWGSLPWSIASNCLQHWFNRACHQTHQSDHLWLILWIIYKSCFSDSNSTSSTKNTYKIYQVNAITLSCNCLAIQHYQNFI